MLACGKDGLFRADGIRKTANAVCKPCFNGNRPISFEIGCQIANLALQTPVFVTIDCSYDAEIGRFICADSLDYLDPHTVGGLNLYAYCGNNPVMNVDPTGHGFWDAFLNVIAAVAVVVVVTAAVVATAGVAAAALGASTAVVAAVTTGAAIGGIAAGTSEIVSQCITEGAEKLDIGAVAIETFIGSAHGVVDGIAATTGSVAVRLGCKAEKVALGIVQVGLHNENGTGDSFYEQAKSIVSATAAGSGIQGGLIVWDKHKGNLSMTTLQLSPRRYGAKQMLLTALIRIGANLWRNRKEIFNAFCRE